MNNANTKNKLYISIPLCILACLAGAAFFGLIYGLGYYIYILPVLEVIIGVFAYLKFSKVNWLNTAISIILSCALVILFNIFAVIIAENVILSRELNISFGSAFSIFMNAVKTNATVKGAFYRIIGQSSAISILGAVIATAYLIFVILKSKKEAKMPKPTEQTANNTPAKENKIEKEVNLLADIYTQVKNIVDEYEKNKDMLTFKQLVNEVKQNKINPLSASEKENLTHETETLLAKSNEKKQKTILQIIQKLLK